MAFYTTAYPPDLAHVSLSSTLIFVLLALLDLLPHALLNYNPLLLFGRSPIFFYSIQVESLDRIRAPLFFLAWCFSQQERN